MDYLDIRITILTIKIVANKIIYGTLKNWVYTGVGVSLYTGVGISLYTGVCVSCVFLGGLLYIGVGVRFYIGEGVKPRKKRVLN